MRRGPAGQCCNGTPVLLVAITYQQGRIGTLGELLAAQPAGPDNTVGPTAGYAPEDTVPEFSPFALGMRAYPDAA